MVDLIYQLFMFLIQSNYNLSSKFLGTVYKIILILDKLRYYYIITQLMENSMKIQKYCKSYLKVSASENTKTGVAIIGPAQSGKTCLMNLLLGKSLEREVDDKFGGSSLKIVQIEEGMIEDLDQSFGALNNFQNTCFFKANLIDEFNENTIKERLKLQHFLKNFQKIGLVIVLRSQDLSARQLISIFSEFCDNFGNKGIKQLSEITSLVISRCQDNTIDQLRDEMKNILGEDNLEKQIQILIKTLLAKETKIIGFEDRDYNSKDPIIDQIIGNAAELSIIPEISLFPSFQQTKIQAQKNILRESQEYCDYLLKIMALLGDWTHFYRSDDSEDKKRMGNTFKKQVERMNLGNQKPFMRNEKKQFKKLKQIQNNKRSSFAQLSKFIYFVLDIFKGFENEELITNIQFILRPLFSGLELMEKQLFEKKQKLRMPDEIYEKSQEILLGRTSQKRQNQILGFRNKIANLSTQDKLQACLELLSQNQGQDKNSQNTVDAIKELLRYLYAAEMIEECIECMMYARNYIQIQRFMKQGVSKKVISKNFLKKISKRLIACNQFELAVKAVNHLSSMASNKEQLIKYQIKRMNEIQAKKQSENYTYPKEERKFPVLGRQKLQKIIKNLQQQNQKML